MTSDVFWYYPRLLFLPDHLGDLVFSVYPHLVVALALAASVLRIGTSAAAFWWFVFVFAGMQFNFQSVEGVWISGFRNIRHAHVFAYPIILLLTGYLVALRAKHPRFTHAALAVVLAVSAWQSVSTASKMSLAFGERRESCRFLATLPREVIHADQGLMVWCRIQHPEGGPLRMKELQPNPEPRKREIATIRSGYLVTGVDGSPTTGARTAFRGRPSCHRGCGNSCGSSMARNDSHRGDPSRCECGGRSAMPHRPPKPRPPAQASSADGIDPARFIPHL